MPEIKKTPNGKPYFPDRPDIHFSLSHSRTHVLCALSGAPVGVDIESPRQISKRAVGYFCSPGELALFDPLDLWVLKESYVKLIGGTFALIKASRFSRVGGRIIAPEFAPEFAAEFAPEFAPEKPVMARLYGIGGCRAAVCSVGECPAVSIELVCGSDNHVTGSL